MDFDLNEEQKILQNSAGDFLKKECPKDLVRRLIETGEPHDPGLWRKMAELGWMGLHLPETFGGTGWSFLDLAVLLEEMGYHLCPGPFVSTVVLGATPVLEGGTEAQKQEILPKVAAGEKILTLAMTEADGGCEPGAFQACRARRDGEGWLLEGTKVFVPDAGTAETILVLARTGEGGDPAEGLTLFRVERESPGVTVTPLKTISKDPQYEVALEKVRVGADAVIGPEGGAWPLVKAALDRAAVARAAETVGVIRATLDLTLAYANERVQFGRPIGSFQAIQHYLADMWVDLLGTRNLVYKAAWKISTGEPASGEVSMAKVRAGEMGRKATTVGHRIFGAIGFTMEHDLHLYYRRALANDLTFGDSEFHHEQVAKSLGL